MNTPSAVTMTPAELTALAEHILGTHHALLHRELPRLDAALSAAPRSLRAPFGHLKSLLDDHLMKEERILFPAISRTRSRVSSRPGSPRGGSVT